MERSERVRAILVFVLFGVVALLLVFRLAWLQVGGAAVARAKAEKQFVRREVLPSERAIIVDRNGALLAYDRPVYDVSVEISAGPGVEQSERERVVDDLLDAFATGEPLAGRERAALRKTLLGRFVPPKNARVRTRRGSDAPSTSTWTRPLFDGVESAVAIEQLREVDRRHPAIRLGLQRVTKRVYPLGQAASHVTGLVAQQESGGLVHYGLEALPVCSPGATGSRPFRIDGRGRSYAADGASEPDRPRAVRTTIDARLQEAADRILTERIDPVGGEWSCLLLLDLRDDGILAMAGHPSFDPEEPKGGTGFYCPAVQAAYSPGSAIKPLIFSAALEQGLARPDEMVLCSGSEQGESIKWMMPGGRKIEDDHFVGLTDLAGVIAESSNIGAVKVGMRLGAAGLKGALDLFGIGRPTGIPLPYERAGRQPDAERWRNQRQLNVYTGPSVCQGYELELTPLQLARAFATVVTGMSSEPRLVTEVVDAGGEVVRAPAAPRRRIFSESTVAWMRHAMGETLIRPRGTGHDIADARTKGLIGAKSGTSWRPNTKGSRTYCATFVAFAPLAEPRYLVVAVAQKSFTHKFYGGKYAAPAARDLLLEALGGVLGSRPLASGADVAPAGSRAMEQAARGIGGTR